MKVDTLIVRKLHTIRSQLTDMSLGTTGRQLQLQHPRWHSHGYRLPAIKSWPLDLPPKDSKDRTDDLGRYVSWTWSNLYKISLWTYGYIFFHILRAFINKKGEPGDPWFSLPKSMSLIAIPCSFIRSLGMSRRQGDVQQYLYMYQVSLKWFFWINFWFSLEMWWSFMWWSRLISLTGRCSSFRAF